MDNLSRDMIQCKADGYGVHYGKWKAMQEPKVIEVNEVPEGWRRCLNCGKPFKGRQGQRYCDIGCRNYAYNNSEKGRAVKAKINANAREKAKGKKAE